jgi:hypothetical protein
LDAVGRELLEVRAVLGVPSLGSDHEGKEVHEPVDHGHDLIAFRHGQGPAGAKVVLDIYN